MSFIDTTLDIETMNREFAQALQERRQFVERIIRKLETLDQPDQPLTVEPETPRRQVSNLLSTVKTFADVKQWAARNVEPTDLLILETKFKNKLSLHPERAEDANYLRLLTLVFHLTAANQCARVYGEFNHRAIAAAFSTHLDMYHTLHVLEFACYLAEMAVQIYVQKARIAEVLATLQDSPLTEQQEVTLAKLCLMPEYGQPLGPLYFGDACEDSQKAPMASFQTQAGTDLFAIQDAVNRPDKVQSTLTQRHNLTLAVGFDDSTRREKRSAPYYAPDLDLCLQLRSVLLVKDIKKSPTPALLDKLTTLWQILLPLHIDLGGMKDFQ